MNNGEFYLADAIDAIEEVMASGGEFRLYPRGTSMLPLIVQTRDSVILKRNFDHAAKKHDIAFYRRDNGQFVLHRVMKLCKDGTYVMCGDNQLNLEHGIKKNQIIAYVDMLYRKDKPIEKNAALYRMYVFLWTKMPIRWICFFPRRAIGRLKRTFKRK